MYDGRVKWGFDLKLESDVSFNRLLIEKLDDFKFPFDEVSIDSTSISSQDDVPHPESSGPDEWVELIYGF